MTLYELSLEYGQAAAALWGRIKELEQAALAAEDEPERMQLQGRIRPLRAMYRETRRVEKYLADYYGHNRAGGGEGRG